MCNSPGGIASGAVSTFQTRFDKHDVGNRGKGKTYSAVASRFRRGSLASWPDLRSFPDMCEDIVSVCGGARGSDLYPEQGTYVADLVCCVSLSRSC